MRIRAARSLALVLVAGACGGRSPSGAPQPTPDPLTHPGLALEFPAIDSATLGALSTHLELLARDTALLSSLSPSHPRFYALFRDLEAAHREFESALVRPDAAGQTLYDRLAALTAHADSVFRALKQRERQLPRP